MVAVSVGIATYDRPASLSRVLDSLLEQRIPPDELIVVDDSETTASGDLVADYENDFTASRTTVHYQRGDHHSLPDARNTIRELATTEIVAFIDDDVRCPETWLAALKEGYEQYPTAAAIGGPAISVDGDGIPLYDLCTAGENQNRIRSDGYVVDRSDRWIPPTSVKVDHLLGANMSFRTDVLDEVGGFDPEYRGTGFREESAVFARLWHRDETVMYLPDARIDHIVAQRPDGDGSTVKQTPQGAYWRGRNQVRLSAQEFPETFPQSLVSYLLSPPNRPAPIWKRMVGAVVQRPRHTYQLYRGIVDGVRYERSASKQPNR